MNEFRFYEIKGDQPHDLIAVYEDKNFGKWVMREDAEKLQARIDELNMQLVALSESTLSSIVKQFDEAPADAEFDGNHPILQLAMAHDRKHQQCVESDVKVKELEQRETELIYLLKKYTGQDICCGKGIPEYDGNGEFAGQGCCNSPMIEYPEDVELLINRRNKT